MIWLDGECLCKDCYKYKRYIYNLFIELGVNINSRGFKFWYEAINIYDSTKTIMVIYRELAKKYKMDYTSVERLMRYCILKSKNKIQDRYNYPYKIDNKTFLNLVTKEGEIGRWKNLRNGLSQQV